MKTRRTDYLPARPDSSTAALRSGLRRVLNVERAPVRFSPTAILPPKQKKAIRETPFPESVPASWSVEYASSDFGNPAPSEMDPDAIYIFYRDTSGSPGSAPSCTNCDVTLIADENGSYGNGSTRYYRVWTVRPNGSGTPTLDVSFAPQSIIVIKYSGAFTDYALDFDDLLVSVPPLGSGSFSFVANLGANDIGVAQRRTTGVGLNEASTGVHSTIEDGQQIQPWNGTDMAWFGDAVNWPSTVTINYKSGQVSQTHLVFGWLARFSVVP